MLVSTNLSSLSAQRMLFENTKAASTAMERSATGSKINRAQDDVAGSAIADRMTSQVRGLNMAVKNVNDAMAMLSVADSAASDITDMLQRMRELAIQAASDTNSAADRQYLQDEVNSLIQEIDRVATQTQYNGENLLDGSKNASFQVGADSGQTLGFDFRSLKASSFAGISNPAVSTSGTQSSSGPTTDLTDPVLTGITIDKSVVDVGNGTQTLSVQLSAADESLIRAGYITFRHVENGHDLFGLIYNSEGFEGNALPSISISVDENDHAGRYELSHVQLDDMADNRVITYQSDIGETFPIELVGGDIRPTIANQSYSWSQEVDTSTQSSGYSPTGATSQSYDWSLYNLAGIVSDPASNITAIASITAAIETVTAQRAEYGAMQNRLQFTISNLMSVSENTVAARSRIEDANFATESAVLAKSQVLQQTGAAMLAQANARPQLVLQLIK